MQQQNSSTPMIWDVSQKCPSVCPFACNTITLKNSLFVCFVALRPKSTAMVMAGRSVHLTTLFPGQALTSTVNQYFVHILLLVTVNNSS